MSDVLAGSGSSKVALDELCLPVFPRLGLALSLLDRRPGAVSGGELQRLALARALLGGADLIFADEPTSRLDTISQRLFMELLGEVAASGLAILLASHNERLLEKTADEIVAFP